MTIRATKDFAGNLEKKYQDAHAEINGRGPRHVSRPKGWRLVADNSADPLLDREHVLYVEWCILRRICIPPARIHPEMWPHYEAYKGMTFRQEGTGREVTIR